MSVIIPVVLLAGIALPFIAARRPGRGRNREPRAQSQKPGADDAAPVGYLYVPCVRIHRNGDPAGTRRWVQEVPIVKKTATRIYYASDSWDRREAVVGPGCISREQFEADTRCHWGRCPHGKDPCRHGYPAGVIPIPGDRHRPGQAGRLFFATREAAEATLYRGQRERAERAASDTPPIKALRRAMADAHPDRGGTAERFIEARRRYETALRAA
ncbi:MAG TPA: hypothetical protein VFQ68_40585 [Streptosporangiaceae bacterium]|nr:hypothetical protein [Streptosporangiaceae bacterium]